jgi:hypothetical protein
MPCVHETKEKLELIGAQFDESKAVMILDTLSDGKAIEPGTSAGWK